MTFGLRCSSVGGDICKTPILLKSGLASERETGFEPVTFCLGSKRSTTKLLPQYGKDYSADCIPGDMRDV